MPVTGGEWVMLELFQGNPGVLAGSGEDRFRPRRRKGAEVPVKGYAIPGVMMGDCCQKGRSLYPPAGFLMDFPKGRLQGRFPFFEPPAGKLPQVAPDVIRQPLLDEVIRFSPHNGTCHGDVDFFLLVDRERTKFDGVEAMGKALRLDRAGGAIRIFWGAHQGTEFH